MIHQDYALVSLGRSQSTLSAMGESLETYSHKNQLHINMSKTQVMHLGHSATDANKTLNIIGITLDKSGGFTTHHEALLNDLRQRLCIIRRLKCQMSRGKFLNIVAFSLFVGCIRCNAWITIPARVNQEGKH